MTDDVEKFSEKTLNALKVIKDSSYSKVYSPRGLALLLWPEAYNSCGTSGRRVGYARTAGCYYSKLMRKGLVSHKITDFTSGYYITEKGLETLKNAEI